MQEHTIGNKNEITEWELPAGVVEIPAGYFCD